jgi:hypothetical protein
VRLIVAGFWQLVFFFNLKYFGMSLLKKGGEIGKASENLARSRHSDWNAECRMRNAE